MYGWPSGDGFIEGGDGGFPAETKANWLVQLCLASRGTHARTYVHQELSLAQGVIGVMPCIVSVGCGAGGKNCSGDTADADKEVPKRLGMVADASASAAQLCSVGEERSERR